MAPTNAYDVLKERGFLYQSTDEEGLRALLEQPATCYVGFDPTADSLHVGSLVPIMALVHMQRHGHRPIAIVGAGTAMVGDPSGKSEMRQLLTPDDVRRNALGLRGQLARYIAFEDGRALLLDNGEWLAALNYIEFLRDIGRHFSVNRMLAAESYRMRLESGLSFLEFNYMLLQAYDFLVLYRQHGCLVQMGGQDQWGNIVAGIDLVRRETGKQAYGFTFPLLMNPSGEKFGKTAKGTSVWLSAERTSPYEFYQFWRNVDDAEVGRLLGLFTLLPMDEVRRLAAPGANLNRAKELLAYEATKLCHGRAAAAEAFGTAVATFGAADPEGAVQTSSDIPTAKNAADEALPTTTVPETALREGVRLVDLFVQAGLSASTGEAKKLVKGGGAYLNDERVDDAGRVVTLADLRDGAATLRAGKKRHHRVVLG
jgi:tyrosyl-tRNA synthetase